MANVKAILIGIQRGLYPYAHICGEHITDMWWIAVPIHIDWILHILEKN